MKLNLLNRIASLSLKIDKTTQEIQQPLEIKKSYRYMLSQRRQVLRDKRIYHYSEFTVTIRNEIGPTKTGSTAVRKSAIDIKS